MQVQKDLNEKKPMFLYIFLVNFLVQIDYFKAVITTFLYVFTMYNMCVDEHFSNVNKFRSLKSLK